MFSKWKPGHSSPLLSIPVCLSHSLLNKKHLGTISFCSGSVGCRLILFMGIRQFSVLIHRPIVFHLLFGCFLYCRALWVKPRDGRVTLKSYFFNSVLSLIPKGIDHPKITLRLSFIHHPFVPNLHKFEYKLICVDGSHWLPFNFCAHTMDLMVAVNCYQNVHFGVNSSFNSVEPNSSVIGGQIIFRDLILIVTFNTYTFKTMGYGYIVPGCILILNITGCVSCIFKH